MEDNQNKMSDLAKIRDDSAVDGAVSKSGQDKRRKKMVSIKDVAERAGVSDKTVSRVVNGASNVSATTRDKIRAAIDELGYVPNQGARLLRGQKSKVIGVITDTVSTSPNSVDILRGIQDRVAHTDHSVLIANTSNDPEVERRIWRTFRQHKIEGVLFVTMYHREVRFGFDAPPHPIVLANCTSNSHPDMPAIVPDDYQGGLDAAKFVLSLSRRPLAFLTLNPQITAAKLRSKAFSDVMTAADVPSSDYIVDSGYRGAVGEEYLCAFDKATGLFQLSAEKRPQTILCGNDEIAMQTICAALSLGFRVPKDVAVVGFDDFKMISTGLEPQLTTVALPYYDIGIRAADRLIELLDGEISTHTVEKVPCKLIRRASA